MNILEEAQKIVDGDRREDYGDMQESFNRISRLWSAYTGLILTANDVANMMILLKVSRNKNYHRDSILDIAGYAYCAEKICSEQ